MNGVHDMGGMQGFGPIEAEADEPVFHESWEGRVLALRRVLGAIGVVRPSGFRVELEGLPAADYLSHGYYENWLAGLVEQLVKGGVIGREEGFAGGGPTEVVALGPAEAAELPFRVPQVGYVAEKAGRFQRGQAVRARNVHPVGHTRLPRYVRGRLGVIECERGAQPFPNENAYGRGEHPQMVYGVRFAARELWGEQASARDAVYMDLWDDYLEPA